MSHIHVIPKRTNTCWGWGHLHDLPALQAIIMAALATAFITPSVTIDVIPKRIFLHQFFTIPATFTTAIPAWQPARRVSTMNTIKTHPNMFKVIRDLCLFVG